MSIHGQDMVAPLIYSYIRTRLKTIPIIHLQPPACFFMCSSSTVQFVHISVQDHYAHVLFAVLLISGDIAKRKPPLSETSSDFHRPACPNLRHSAPSM
jgi:hypothetical protein